MFKVVRAVCVPLFDNRSYGPTYVYHILKEKRERIVGMKMTQYDTVYGKEWARSIKKYEHQQGVLGHVEWVL